MGRRYDEDVQVQLDGGADPVGGPAAFIWQQRLYQVREVLGHWYERAPWWESAGSQRLEEETGEREVWRVAASAGRVRGTGTYDLGRTREVPGGPGGAGASGGPDGADGGWQLLGVVD